MAVLPLLPLGVGNRARQDSTDFLGHASLFPGRGGHEYTPHVGRIQRRFKSLCVDSRDRARAGTTCAGAWPMYSRRRTGFRDRQSGRDRASRASWFSYVRYNRSYMGKRGELLQQTRTRRARCGPCSALLREIGAHMHKNTYESSI